MKKLSILLSLLVGVAMVLAACSSAGEKNNENAPAGTLNAPGGGVITGTQTAPLLQTPAFTETSPTPAMTEAPTLAVTSPVTVPATLQPTSPSAVVTGTPTSTVNLPNTGKVGPVQLTQVMDAQLLSQNDENLGHVSDMVINLNNQHVDYVLFTLGSTFNLGDNLVAIPWNDLDLRHPANDTSLAFYFKGNNQALQNAPNFAANQMPDFTTPNWDEQWRAFWNSQPGLEVVPAVTGTVTSTVPLTTTGSMTSTMGTGTLNRTLLASKLLDYNVQGANGEDLGEVKDAIINPQSGKIQYVVLASGGVLGIGEKWIPVPLKALTIGQADNTFALNVTQQDLSNAPNFDLNKLPDTTAPGWDANLQSYWNQLIH